jgi:hypothetical protein
MIVEILVFSRAYFSPRIASSDSRSWTREVAVPTLGTGLPLVGRQFHCAAEIRLEDCLCSHYHDQGTSEMAMSKHWKEGKQMGMSGRYRPV